MQGDVRDPEARAPRWRASRVVHLAAIVGDPACAREPEAARTVNLEATARSSASAAEAGVERFVFASTCSNYGHLEGDEVATEEWELRSRCRSTRRRRSRPSSTCSPLGERICDDLPPLRDRLRRVAADAVRPHRQRVHARRRSGGRSSSTASSSGARTSTSATRRTAILLALEAPVERARPRSSTSATPTRTTASSTSSSSCERVPDADVAFVHRDEDPRDYRVNFEKIASGSASRSSGACPTGSTRSRASCPTGPFADPYSSEYRN